MSNTRGRSKRKVDQAIGNVKTSMAYIMEIGTLYGENGYDEIAGNAIAIVEVHEMLIELLKKFDALI